MPYCTECEEFYSQAGPTSSIFRNICHCCLLEHVQPVANEHHTPKVRCTHDYKFLKDLSKWKDGGQGEYKKHVKEFYEWNKSYDNKKIDEHKEKCEKALKEYGEDSDQYFLASYNYPLPQSVAFVDRDAYRLKGKRYKCLHCGDVKDIYDE